MSSDDEFIDEEDVDLAEETRKLVARLAAYVPPGEDRRYLISIYLTDDAEWDIEHEVDHMLLGIADSLYYGSESAKEEWAPHRELWPELMDIEESDEGDEEFGILRYLDTEQDSWPGQNSFWGAAMSLGIDDVGEVGGGSPGSGRLYRIQTLEALVGVLEALKDKYRFEFAQH